MPPPPPPLCLCLFPFPHSSLRLSLGHSCGDLSVAVLINRLMEPLYLVAVSGAPECQGRPAELPHHPGGPIWAKWAVKGLSYARLPHTKTFRTNTHAGVDTKRHKHMRAYIRRHTHSHLQCKHTHRHAHVLNTLALTATHPCVPTWFVTLHQ